jgi:hypothetical protein
MPLRSNASSSASRSPAGVNTRPSVSVFRITAVSVVGEVVDVIARSLRHLRLFQIEGLGVTLTKVRQEPKNYSWAYEMKFEDIDGNVRWLGTEPKSDIPLEDKRDR